MDDNRYEHQTLQPTLVSVTPNISGFFWFGRQKQQTSKAYPLQSTRCKSPIVRL